MNRLRYTLQQISHHYLLRRTIDKHRYEHCLKHKLPSKGYGLLPQREMICIDTASNLVKLICIDNKTAVHIRDRFIQSWLIRYPRPIRCVHDKGREFISSEFQRLLNMFSFKYVQSTANNPQSNSIYELMHQMVENVLCTFLHNNPPQNMIQAKDIID